MSTHTRSEVIFPIDGMREWVLEVGYAMPDARLFLWMASVAHDAVVCLVVCLDGIQTHDQTHQLEGGGEKIDARMSPPPSTNWASTTRSNDPTVSWP